MDFEECNNVIWDCTFKGTEDLFKSLVIIRKMQNVDF